LNKQLTKGETQMANAKQKTALEPVAKSSFTFQNLVSGDTGETLQHLACRSLIWHIGGQIARHQEVVNYGATRLEISQGNGNLGTLDGVIEKTPLDLSKLLGAFYYLQNCLYELAIFEDYDTRTGAPTSPFAWYTMPSIESYIRNFQNYRTSRVNTARQDQAKALGLKVEIPLVNNTTEIDELVKNAIEVLHGFYNDNLSNMESLEEIVSEMKIDPLYIIHQSAVSMLDRARASLMSGKAGYIDPEILAFARWTCRPQQGLQQPE
jgi:hypothetical protein